MTPTPGDPAVALPVDARDAPKRSIGRDVRLEPRSFARCRGAFGEGEPLIPEYDEAVRRARGPLRAAV